MRPSSLLIALLAAAGCGGNWFHPGPGGGSGDPPFGDDDAGDPPFTPQPVFGTTVTQAVPPPPISGGTLAVLSSGLAVAADPDRDRIYVVDVAAGTKVADIALVAGDQPGRVIED